MPQQGSRNLHRENSHIFDQAHRHAQPEFMVEIAGMQIGGAAISSI
jgi:hypothetical protein